MSGVIKMREPRANNVIAALLVDSYGSKARDKVAGPMLEAVNAVIAERNLEPVTPHEVANEK